MKSERSISACAVAFALLLGGCGSTPAAETPGETTAAGKIWRSKCGSCHVPIEPGAMRRTEIEAAMERHKKRLRLDPDEWTTVVDFLARDRETAERRD